MELGRQDFRSHSVTNWDPADRKFPSGYSHPLQAGFSACGGSLSQHDTLHRGAIPPE